jgi:hypothetical protein
MIEAAHRKAGEVRSDARRAERLSASEQSVGVYRLEQLRLLGLLDRVTTGEANNAPIYAWTLSEMYQTELGLPHLPRP